MGNEWWRHLTGRPFYWVLDGSHPAATFYMLRHVVERPEEARARRAARLALRESPGVAALKARLEGDAEQGLWSPRYDAPFWALRLLAELGVPGDDERIATALDRVLGWEGHADSEPAPINLDALVAQMALAFGFGEDERVRARLARLRHALEANQLPPTAVARADWLVQAALALAEQPARARDPLTCSQLAAHLETLSPEELEHYHTYGFPTFDQPDGLALAEAALRLGLRGVWLQPWVVRIEAAQDEQGLWRLGRALPMPAVQGEAVGAPSRWISARALFVLRAFYGE